MRILSFVFTMLATIGLSFPVHAAWHEASSEHFVIYADQSPKLVKAYAERLERFHSGLTYLLKSKKHEFSPSNRVTIFVVSENQIRKLSGAQYVAGFYNSAAGASVAFVPPFSTSSSGGEDFRLSTDAESIDSFSGEIDEGQNTLFHEYAHHYMYSNSEAAYPRWYSEGFAEFYGTSKIEKDGSIWLGVPAQHRSEELLSMPDVTIEALFDEAVYAAKEKNGYNNFYGRSWLLYHYLMLNNDRNKQMVDYIRRINNSEPSLDAAKAAFGDFKILNKELRSYLNKDRMLSIKLSPDKVPIKPVTVRQMTAGQDAVMPHRIISKRGVDEKLAKEILVKIQDVAAQYPNDAFVLATLAEAQHDAGQHDTAIATADKALALEPRNIDALIQKGYALTKKAELSNNDADWATVRKHFVSVNKVEPNHPVPLMYNYRSYVEQGREPSAVALQGLEWAFELAPFDVELRWNLAQIYVHKKRYADAVYILRPLTYDPHNENPEAQTLLDMAIALQAAEQKAKAATAATG